MHKKLNQVPVVKVFHQIRPHNRICHSLVTDPRYSQLAYNKVEGAPGQGTLAILGPGAFKIKDFKINPYRISFWDEFKKILSKIDFGFLLDPKTFKYRILGYFSLKNI